MSEVKSLKLSYSGLVVNLLKRDLLLSFHNRGEWLNPLSFLFIVVTLFPLAVSPSREVLLLIAPGIIWIAALLSTLISVDRLFREDFEDGSVEQWITSPQPLFVFAFSKLSAHWFISGLPLVIFAPVLGASFNLSAEALGILVISLLLGTPSLSSISAIAAALTVSLRSGGLIVALITLPLYVPILVFGTGAVMAGLGEESAKGPLLMLAAFLVLSVSLAPFAISASLKLNVANG